MHSTRKNKQIKHIGGEWRGCEVKKCGDTSMGRLMGECKHKALIYEEMAVVTEISGDVIAGLGVIPFCY